MRKIKSFLAFLLVIAIVISQMVLVSPVMAADAGAEPDKDADTEYYIKNNYATGAYLYEADGELYYGVPTENDARFRWQIESEEENSRLKNAATGHYISLSGHGTDEGSFADAVVCTDSSDEDALWSFEIGEGVNILSASASFEGFGIHLEEVTDGKVRAQNIGGDQLKWGNMKWNFLTAKDINFTAALREGICIQTAGGEYLKADAASVVSGIPEGADDSYIWMVEEQADGSKALKNKALGLYLVIENGSGYALSADSAPINFQIGMSTVPAMASDELYSSSVAWNIYTSSQVGNVAGDLKLDGVYCLKNSWYFMYLIEEDGTAIYGNAGNNDKNAQWEFVYDTASGKTGVKNVGTGHYLHPSGDGDKLVCDDTENYYWNLLRNQSDLYPDAVVLQDSAESTFFVHMENLNGFAQCSNAVQPTWGTPHWETVLCSGNETSSVGDAVQLPSSAYVRIGNAGEEKAYLYENTSGVVVYGASAETDARSHWELIKDEESGYYRLKNREFGNYVTVNQATGSMKSVEEAELVNASGTLFEFVQGAAEGSALIRSVFDGVSPYQSPYVNIGSLSGMAVSTLESIEELTSQWYITEAPEDTAAVEDDEESGYICLNTYTDTNEYRIKADEEYLEGIFELEYYGSTVRLKNTESGKYIVFDAEKGEWQYKEAEADNDISVQWSISKRAGALVLRSGDTRVQAEAVNSKAVYAAEDAYVNDGVMSFAVYAESSGEYTVNFISDAETESQSEIYINGISAGSYTVPSEAAVLKLNKGINTISLEYNENLKAIELEDTVDKDYRGASAGYVVYEAETCTTTGTVLEDDRSYGSVTAEASGRSAVELGGTSQSIKFTLLKDANLLTLRYCIPDSEDGAGLNYTLDLTINGNKTSVELTSKYTWVYGAYPYTNNPSDGTPHRYFDDVTVELGGTYPAGTEIKLSKSASNQSPYYIIDFIEAELVEEVLNQPENSLSIADYGAKADDGEDDTDALMACIDEAASQGREVWLPAGEFTFNKEKLVIDKDGVTIRGAGMHYTTIAGDYAAFVIKGSNIAFYDFSMRGTAVVRRDNIDPAAFEADYNTSNKQNLVIQNIWMEHYKVGVWTYNVVGVHIVGCRIRNTFADGINLCMGTCNSLVEQCSIRGTGDDALAMWSQNISDVNNAVKFNTIASPNLANCVALYGGTDIIVSDNILADTITNGAGVNISTNFTPKDFAGQIIVERNTLNRCGTTADSYNQDYGAVWFNTITGYDNNAEVIVRDNVITDSSYQGISFGGGGEVTNVTIEGNAIENSSTWAIDAGADAKGSATARNNQMRGNGLGTVNNSNEDKFTLTVEILDKPEDVKASGSAEGSSVNGGLIAGIAGGAAVILAAGIVTGAVVSKKKSKKAKEQ